MPRTARSIGPLPFDICCFIDTVAGVECEAIQGDIFDHLVAILLHFGLPHFGLPHSGMRLVQNPPGLDLRAIRSAAPTGTTKEVRDAA